MYITSLLAKDFANINSLSENDRNQLKTFILDYFAAAYAGKKMNKGFNRIIEKIRLNNNVNKVANVFLYGKSNVETAAFMNACYAHGAELDDGNKKAMGHIGVHVISAVFALADMLESKQEDILISIATGYEAYIRISSAAQPGMVQRGFHSTGMAGTLACAVACAKLYHLDANCIENALALSTTMSGGLLSYGDSRPAIKPLNPGKAAENGIFAAMLANEGMEGPKESLEGVNGWFGAVTDLVEEKLLRGADHLLLHDCYIKQYPSCRHTHCGIEAAINLHEKVAITDIEAINIYIYPNAIKLAGQIHYPKDKDETKFSIHYTFATALKYGAYGIDDMDPPNLSKEIVSIIDRINLISEPNMENREKGIRGTKVEIRCKDGRKFDATVNVPKGDPENPLSRDDVISKLKTCAQGIEDKKKLDDLINIIDNIGGDNIFINPMSILGKENVI